jgi:hypothetical protein
MGRTISFLSSFTPALRRLFYALTTTTVFYTPYGVVEEHTRMGMYIGNSLEWSCMYEGAFL